MPISGGWSLYNSFRFPLDIENIFQKEVIRKTNKSPGAVRCRFLFMR